MSGWLGCCECLQRRAMTPARRRGSDRPASPPPPPQGHHNAAFLGDEEATSPPSECRQLQRETPEDAVGPESASRPPPAPPEERYRVVPLTVGTQNREICDLRDVPRSSRWWPVGRKTPRSRPPASPHRPRSPAGRETGTEWPAEEPPVAPQRRLSLLDNIPETSEVTETGEATETAEANETSKVIETALGTERETVAEKAPGSEADGGTVESGPKSVSPPSEVKQEDGTSPSVDDENDTTGKESPAAAERAGHQGRERAASLGAPLRLAFPLFRRRSSQRRQSAGGASAGGAQREPSRERSWLRRLSRSRPSGALKADQPPEQPRETLAAAASESQATSSLAKHHWEKIRDNFDLDAPLTEHWGFLDHAVDDFAKIDAKAYTEHLHECSPISSSTSDDEVPDEMEAQLMCKLARAERRRSSVSNRCKQLAREKRRKERRRSSSEGATSAGETDCESKLPAPGEDGKCPEMPEKSPVLRDSGTEKQASEELRPALSGSGGERSGDAPPVEEVHHPTWFDKVTGPESAAGSTSDQRSLSRQRDTVVEVSLQEFLEEVEQCAQHLREEEFSGADPYQVLAPEQRAADDDHIVPMLNMSRCMDLMLADAEEHLKHEYSAPPSPSPRLSPCPTPRTAKDSGRRADDSKAAGGAKAGETAATQNRYASSGQPAAGPSRGPGGSSQTAKSVSGSQHRAQAAQPGSGPRRGTLTYLTDVAESLKTKLQETLNFSHDSELCKYRSKSPLQTTGMRKLSQGAESSCDVAPPPSGGKLEKFRVQAAKSMPSTTPTPRNSAAHPSQQPSPADVGPLAGYHQTSLALARQSTVGYQQLALALAREQGAAAADGGPARSQAVQTSPGVASPVEHRPTSVAGQSRSVQTSPGTSTPADGTNICSQCGCTQGVPTCSQGNSRTQNVPTCSQCGCVPPDPVAPPSIPGPSEPSPDLVACLSSPPENRHDPEPAGGGSVWTVPVSDDPPAAPPARLLAYGQPSWVDRQQSGEEAAALRRRIDSGQRAAGKRRDTLLRRRADRAAQLSAPAGHRPGGDHDRAAPPARPEWR